MEPLIASNIQIPDSVWRTILDRLKAAAPGAPDAGIFNGAKCKLFANDVTPTRNTLLAGFTEATFTGYAEQSITYGAALTDGDGNNSLTPNNCQFNASGAGTTNTIYGAYVTDSGGTTLLYSWRFASSVSVTHAGDGLVVCPQIVIERS